MARAVAREDFEIAAALRDRINLIRDADKATPARPT